MSWCDNA